MQPGLMTAENCRNLRQFGAQFSQRAYDGGKFLGGPLRPPCAVDLRKLDVELMYSIVIEHGGRAEFAQYASELVFSEF